MPTVMVPVMALACVLLCAFAGPIIIARECWAARLEADEEMDRT